MNKFYKFFEPPLRTYCDLTCSQDDAAGSHDLRADQVVVFSAQHELIEDRFLGGRHVEEVGDGERVVDEREGIARVLKRHSRHCTVA